MAKRDLEGGLLSQYAAAACDDRRRTNANDYLYLSVLGRLQERLHSLHHDLEGAGRAVFQADGGEHRQPTRSSTAAAGGQNNVTRIETTHSQ